MRREWEPEDLIACWTLVEDDWRLVANKRGGSRLAFALLLKFFELEGRFPRHVGELPRQAPSGTECSVGSTSSLQCVYSDPNVTVTPACKRLLQTAPRTHVQPRNSQVQPMSTHDNCTNSGLQPKYANAGNTQYYSATLWAYQAPGYFCYFLTVWNGSQNYFDFDDYWYINVRIWHCGSPWPGEQGTGTGPPAQLRTSVIYYGTCGAQADDAGSWGYIDYVQEYFPYVHIG